MIRICLSLLTVIISITLAFGQVPNKPFALKVGEMAPLFTATDQNQQEYSLKEELKKGPVLITFYRGQWCGYCNRYMSALQDSLPLLKEHNISVVAITPETQENVQKSIEKTSASFTIISDRGQEIMHLYKTLFALSDETIEKYKGYGIILPEVNTKNTWTLPVPATYLIDTDGKTIFSHFDEDYSKRASIKSVLNALD